MSRLVLALILAGAPPAQTPAAHGSTAPVDDGALPHWRELPPPPPPPAPPAPADRVPFPRTGTGMIALGGTLLGVGAVVGFTSLGMALAGNPDNGQPMLGAIMTIPHLVGGGASLALGLIARERYRASPLSKVADQPPTGGGLLSAGVGLTVIGIAHGAYAAVDLRSSSCSAFRGCEQVRPVSAPIHAGAAVVAFGAGLSMTAFGIYRRVGYVDWGRYQPFFQASRGRATLGVAGRF